MILGVNQQQQYASPNQQRDADAEPGFWAGLDKEVAVGSVAVKAPPFYRKSPEAWFR